MISRRDREARGRSARAVASASPFGVGGDVDELDREACYDMMAQVSLSLMSFVAKDLGEIMSRTPEVAVRLAEIRRVILEVTEDLESYRDRLRASEEPRPQASETSAVKT